MGCGCGELIIKITGGGLICTANTHIQARQHWGTCPLRNPMTHWWEVNYHHPKMADTKHAL